MVMARSPLPGILGALCSAIEREHTGLLCSVLLLDADGTTLRTVAAPSLPMEFSQSINGARVGPCAGSCGTAVYRKEQVVVSDIASDSLWSDYRHLALPHGLRACWSTPILVPGGAVGGTFAIYYREPCTPTAQHLEIIAHATHLAGIAIEHDRAQAQLRAVEDRYRTLVERLPAITYVAELGADGPWHYVSPQIESMLGYSPEEWLADPMSWMNCIQPEDREIALAAERNFQETHEFFYAEYRMSARDGRVLWFRDEAVLLQETEDHGLLMQGVLYDITAHKRLEEDLRHSQKMEAVGQLAGGVAHDFNNLLMLIQAHNERLRERLKPAEEAQEDVLQISRAVTRAAALTRQLLAFSRKQILHVKVLDLNEVVTQVAKVLGRLIGTNIELSVRQGPALGRVKADPGQIEQVIVNLAVNARDAMPQGGGLRLETRNVSVKDGDFQNRDSVPAGNYVLLAVSDNGIGMNLETQSRIFEPFFTTKDPGKGTGLGLATVYGVVKQMDGAIRVDSAPGKGTTFEIYLPRVDGSQASDPVLEGKKTIDRGPQGTETILLAEDQDGIRDLVREFLRRKGYTVLFANDGEDALRIAGEHGKGVDLLLTDLIMPNVGGRDLARRLRQQHPKMRVLFMSGYAAPAASGGEGPVLQKPFLLDELAHKIRELLDSTAAQ
jgi:two-component system, cell cycle sensor histidine kinase and response regulator CckA